MLDAHDAYYYDKMVDSWGEIPNTNIAAAELNNLQMKCSIFYELLWFLCNEVKIPEEYGNKRPRVLIRPDSDYAMKAVLGKAKTLREEAVRLTTNVRSIFIQACEKFKIELVWIKGHMNYPGNQRADELAEKGGRGRWKKMGRWRNFQRK